MRRAHAVGWRLIVPTAFVALAAVARHTVMASPLPEPQERTVWQQVYSAGQAERGRVAYERHCASCHGGDLAGGRTTALLGESFMRGWSEANLYDLFDKIRTTMPPNLGRGLPDDVYVDIVAYVLRENAFPTGPAALAADAETLRHIRIQRQGGPAPVPSFALVKVVGCLEGRVNDDWLLTRASEPVRATTPDISGDAGHDVDMDAARTLSFRLFDLYPAPEHDVGHEVEVKGFLIRTASADRINVTALRPVGATCETRR